MKIRLAGEITKDSIVDGEGLRNVIWTQGCNWHCKECQNQETWDLRGGFLKDVDVLLSELLKSPNDITFSGGDPFLQPKECAYLAKKLKEQGKNIWSYTGFVFEDLLELCHHNINIKNFLDNIDVLVDGKFMIELKSMECPFRGSSNQRLIDLPRSLKKDKVVLYKLKKEKNKKQKKIYI